MCYSPSFANGSIGMRWLCCKWDVCACVCFFSLFSYWNQCCHLNAKHHVILIYHAINYKYYSHFDILLYILGHALHKAFHFICWGDSPSLTLSLSLYRHFALFPSLTLWRVQYFQPFSLYCRNIGKCRGLQVTRIHRIILSVEVFTVNKLKSFHFGHEQQRKTKTKWRWRKKNSV